MNSNYRRDITSNISTKGKKYIFQLSDLRMYVYSRTRGKYKTSYWMIGVYVWGGGRTRTVRAVCKQLRKWNTSRWHSSLHYNARLRRVPETCVLKAAVCELRAQIPAGRQKIWGIGRFRGVWDAVPQDAKQPGCGRPREAQVASRAGCREGTMSGGDLLVGT